MLDIREIEYWISRYETEADKLEHWVTLSALYYIRDKLLGQSDFQPQQIAAYSAVDAPGQERLGQYGDSDFLQAVAGKDPYAAWGVMDELMETLQVVNQRAYDSVMRKLYRI